MSNCIFEARGTSPYGLTRAYCVTHQSYGCTPGNVDHMSEYENALERRNGDVVQVAANEPFEYWPVGESTRMMSDLVRAIARAELERREVALKTHQQDLE